MHHEQFIEKHRIQLTPPERRLCDEAMRLMSRSVDVHHDSAHIGRLLDYLDEFTATDEYRRLAPGLDLKVLLVSVLWHDCWRSRKDPGRITGLLWCTLYEGIGASSIFSRAAKRLGVGEALARRVSYAIRKHAYFKATSPSTLEARLLAAVDTLDHYSFERLKGLERKYLVERPISGISLRLAKLAIRLFVEPERRATRFFRWSKRRIHERKQRFLARVRRQVEEYRALLDRRKSRRPGEFTDYLRHLQEKYVS